MLSPLERSCLKWLSEGRNVSAIASLEGKTVGEIDDCLTKVLATLGVKFTSGTTIIKKK